MTGLLVTAITDIGNSDALVAGTSGPEIEINSFKIGSTLINNAIASISDNAGLIQINLASATQEPTAFVSTDIVVIYGTGTSADGTWPITVVNSQSFTLIGSVFSAVAGAGGFAVDVTQLQAMTDVAGLVYTGLIGQLTYRILANNQVRYTITLDETVGDFNVGNIGLYNSDGTLFAITAMPFIEYKYSSGTNGLGDRRIWNIILQYANLATISNFVVSLSPDANLPEVANETLLPNPATTPPYSTYQVQQLTFRGLSSPALAFNYNNEWWYVTYGTALPNMPLNETESDARYLLASDDANYVHKAGDTMSGNLGIEVSGIDPEFFLDNLNLPNTDYREVHLQDPTAIPNLFRIRKIRPSDGAYADLTWSDIVGGEILTSNNFRTYLNSVYGANLAGGQCQLVWNSTTQFSLMPKNGVFIINNGVQYALPVTGIYSGVTGVYVDGIAGSTPSVQTTFYVSYNNNGGSPVLKLWTQGSNPTTGYWHMPDTSPTNLGVEVIALNGVPVSAESLVGMIYIDNAGQIYAAHSLRTWFNDPGITKGGSTLNATQAGGGGPYFFAANNTWGDISGGGVINLLTWANNIVAIDIAGALTITNPNVSGINTEITIGVNFDNYGAIGGDNEVTALNPFVNVEMIFPMSTSLELPFAEGKHFVFCNALVNETGGTGATFTYNFGIYVSAN